MTAHVAGVPVEELVTALAGAGVTFAAARAWLGLRLRGRRGPGA